MQYPVGLVAKRSVMSIVRLHYRGLPAAAGLCFMQERRLPKIEQVNHHERSAIEMETLRAWPELHPFFYIDPHVLLKSARRSETLKDHLFTFFETPEFTTARSKYKEIVYAITKKGKEILRAKGKLNNEENRPSELVHLILYAKANEELTEADEDALNLEFYKLIEEYLRLSLPRRIVEVEQVVDNKIETKFEDRGIDLEACNGFFNLWSGEADRLATEFAEEQIGHDPQFTEIPEELKTMKPYELVLHTRIPGEMAMYAGRKLALTGIFSKVSQMFSRAERIDLETASDAKPKEEINLVLKKLDRAKVFVTDDQGQIVFKEVTLNIYIDPLDQFKPKILSYNNFKGEKETVFSLGDGFDVKVKKDLSDIIYSEQEVSIEDSDIKQAFDDFFKRRRITDEKERLRFIAYIKDTLERYRNQKLIQSEEGEECRLINISSLQAAIKSEEEKKSDLANAEEETVYVIVDTREKVRQSIVIKLIRRGLKNVSMIQDLRGISFKTLCRGDLIKVYSKLEHNIGGNQFDLHDNLIHQLDDLRADEYSASTFPMRTYKVFIPEGHLRGGESGSKDTGAENFLVYEIQEHTFFSHGQGVAREAHWRYRLRQYFGNFFRIIYPPEFFGERFNIKERLQRIRAHYHKELEDDVETIRAEYEASRQSYKERYGDGAIYPYSFAKYLTEIYPRQFFSKLLYKHNNEDDTVSGLLTLSYDELYKSEHHLKDDLVALKKMLNMVTGRTQLEVDRILKTTDRYLPGWNRLHESHLIDLAIKEASIDFILDFLHPVPLRDTQDGEDA